MAKHSLPLVAWSCVMIGVVIFKCNWMAHEMSWKYSSLKHCWDEKQRTTCLPSRHQLHLSSFWVSSVLGNRSISLQSWEAVLPGLSFLFLFFRSGVSLQRCRVMAVWATSGVGTEGLCTTATEWISSIVLEHLNHCSSLHCIISHDAMPRPVCCFSCLVIHCSLLRKLH